MFDSFVRASTCRCKMAVWSVEAVTEFIRLFREHPCLWKIKSKDYSNRNMRNKAYDELVDFCKTVGFATANREFVTKKIQNLRGAFRKELKKVTETRNKSGSSQDDVYKPSLWYFDLLLFTKDQELPTPSISNIMTEDETESETVQDPENCTSPSQQHSVDAPTSQQAPNFDQNIVEEPARGVKRKVKANVIDTQIKFMNVCTEALKKKEMTEYEALSITIAKKLEKMNSIQAIHAETIIHSVLRRGLLNQLTDSTDICDKQCNKTIILSSSNMPRLSSSASSVHTEATYHSPIQPTLGTQNPDVTEDESQCLLKDYYNNYTDLE